jgi:hypothetical protein
MDAKSYLAEACVDVAFHLGGIRELLTSKHVTDSFLSGNNFKNFLNEMLIEARSGKITALALNLAVLHQGLCDMRNDNTDKSSELKEAIDDSIWKCRRAIDVLYKYDNVDQRLFLTFGHDSDD